jgi:type IV secretion system protein VirB10
MRWIFALFFISVFAFSAQQPAPSEAQPAEPAKPTLTVPTGTQIPLKLSQGISTKNARIGDPVYAETVFPVTQNDRILIPAGTFIQGRITEIHRAGRVKGKAEFLMHFTTMIFKSGYTIMLPGAVEGMPGSEQQKIKDKEGTIQQEGTKGKDLETVGKVAGAGAGVGSIAGRSLKGAGIGGAAGAAAGLWYVLLTRGPDVTLPAGTSVEMVLERPLVLQESKIQ